MTMFLAPYTAIADIDGSPLDAGFLFFGEFGKNPETHPIPVYWDADFAVPAAQPIRTRNGYPIRNGSPCKIYLKQAEHSLVVKNKNLSAILVEMNNKGISSSLLVRPDGNTVETSLVEIDAALETKASNEYVDNQVGLMAPQATTYSKSEVDSALSFKAPQATTYTKAEVDTAFAAYVGGRKAYTTLALAQADQANLTVNTAIEVTNDGANNGTYQWNGTTLTKSDYDPLTQAKNYTDAYATVKSKTIADATDFNNVTEEGLHRVISNVSALTMLNCPSTRAGVLEVLRISSSLLIQRYTPYGIDKKAFQRANDTGVWPATWEEVLFKSEADLLFTTKNQVSESVSSAISAVTQSSYFGEKFSESEILGSAFYTAGTYVGYNSIYDTDIVFNAIECRIINQTAGDIEYRVYLGSKVVGGTNGYRVTPQSNVGNPDFSGVCKSFPSNDTGEAQLVVLDKAIAIPKDTPFVIVFKAADLTKFNIAYAPAVTGNLENRSFNLSTATGDWNSLTIIGNADTSNGYVQAGFKLLVSIPQQSGGEVTPEPTVHVPDIVLPPKILTMKDLESNIFFNHVLKEDYKDYLVDITCTKGKQYSRKWVYNYDSTKDTDTANTATLTIALHDKKKGDLLTSKTTTVQNVASSSNAGTKNVLVIGDSYVNAGVITQTLLDNAVNDVTKINLIGTRGTGLNKHEGRGGWKISDYATVGRTYYAFTVSGVTTQPAINSTVYEFGGGTFTVQELNLTAGAGTIVCSFTGTAPTNGTSGTLTKKSGVGNETITFSDVQSQSGNPFWFSGAIDFPQYLSANSLTAPDYVIIQLGVNDSFNATSDAQVESIADAAFIQLDAFIASIKSANANVKIGLNTCPTYADQDAFGNTYSNAQTSWRAKRNIVTWNKKLIAKYGANANNVHVVAAGYNLDSDYNMQTIATVPNARNATAITLQKDGVHPGEPGYKQIADQDTIWIKSS
ncbi:GDSL-type esterase/lipase family protein [Acinetobacter indicus]|uniref:GDSL-type esterase/lipase family protein n=1 Tax=Acinetobacter indicus TaxID=756892 RepID=UPI001443CD99|nr:GDSL-type esterase/lipase family protein [Acinetobacter indicus]